MLTRRNFFKFPAQVAAFAAASSVLISFASVPVRSITLLDLARMNNRADAIRILNLLTETNSILAGLPWEEKQI